jgi:hypothetical protein
MDYVRRSLPSTSGTVIPMQDPDSLPNVLRDYRADTGVTGSPVSAWAPRIGSGILTAAGVEQPTFNAADAGFNNEPTLSFDGLNNLMSRAGEVIPVAPWTLFVVIDNDNMSNKYLLHQSFATGDNYVRMNGSLGSPADTFGVESTGSALVGTDASSPSLLTLTYDGSGNVQVYQNGGLIGTASNTDNAITPGDNFQLAGIVGGASSNRAQFDIAHMTVCNVVSAPADIANVAAWYDDRYGPF